MSLWLSVNALDQRSYSTPRPVNAWMGDRLRTGKPPRRSTRHPRLLSLSHLSVGWRNEYPAKAGEYTGTSRDTPIAHIRGLAVLADVWLRTS